MWFKFFKPFLPTSKSPTLAEIVDSLKDAVILIGEDYALEYANPYWFSLTGMNPAEIGNTSLVEFIHPEDHESWLASMQKILQSRQSELIWLRIISSEGQLYWCEIRLQSLFPDRSFPVSATLCDITPQIRSNQVKEARYRSLKGLVDRVPAMIYRSRNNLDWTMEYVTEGCFDLTGFRPEKLLNNAEFSYGSLIHEDDKEYVWVTVQKAFEAKRCFEISYRLKHASGHYVKVHEKGCALYSDTGQVLGIEGLIFSLESLP